MKNYGYIIIFGIGEYVHLNELTLFILIYKQLINNEI